MFCEWLGVFVVCVPYTIVEEKPCKILDRERIKSSSRTTNTTEELKCISDVVCLLAYSTFKLPSPTTYIAK